MTDLIHRRGGVAQRKNRESKQPTPVGRIIMLLAGWVILILALPPFFDFPWLQFWLVPLVAIYLLLLRLLPRLWLLVVPLATVGFDITPWTGRFAYNELDLLFIATLVSGLLYNRYRFKVFSPSVSAVVMLLYLILIGLGYAGWAMFAAPPEAAFDNPYYTDAYAYKVLKGMVWGAALVPMWGHLLAQDKKRAVTSLVLGLCLAALVFGLIVLWERGTLGVLLSGSAWYHSLSSFLDLTSSYRITGIFSDMHTGGETIDGVLLLLLPATMYAAIHGKMTWFRVLGVLGFLALAYVALVGFTRATYVAFAFAVLIFSVLTIGARRASGLPTTLPLMWLSATLALAAVVAVVAFRYAGSYGLASFGAILLVAYAKSRLELTGYFRHAASSMVVLLVLLAATAHFGSRWVGASYIAVVLLATSLVFGYIMTLQLFEKSRHLSQTDRLLTLGAVLLLPVMLAFALGGSQINDRITRVSSDLDTRQGHWNDVVESAGDGLFSSLFGNGAGSFPASYIAAHPQRVKDVGSFTIVRQLPRVLLRLGGGHDLTLGQRVAVEPFTDYELTVHLRSAQAGRLVFALCERNLIYASNFMPNCVRKVLKFEATDNLLDSYTITLNSGRVGERGALWRWPTVLALQYDQVGTVLEIDSLQLSNDGFNALRNGSFKSGLDYWFYYNDFSHLPWHVKNTFLQVWFEAGWLGLGLFLAMIGLLLRESFKRHAFDSLVPAYTTGVLTICVFGLFGSPLDSARVSWIFYFFLFSGLASLRGRKKISARTQGHI